MRPGVSLEFSLSGQVLFESVGTWLHPLFELEEFLKDSAKGASIDPCRGEIHDKVVGRASAFLIVRLGIRKVHARMLSRLGKDVLDRAGAACTWEVLVDEVKCSTEGMLREVTDAEKAYGILLERARKTAPPRQGSS